MSTVSLTGASAYAGNDRLLAGIVMSVLTFWLFAQSVINVVPAMQNSLDIALETLTLAVSLSALFSGCFVVACGGFADKFGRMRLTMTGLILSMIGRLRPGMKGKHASAQSASGLLVHGAGVA